MSPPSLNILMAKIGKILGENRGNFLKKREKRILSTPLNNVLVTLPKLGYRMIFIEVNAFIISNYKEETSKIS